MISTLQRIASNFSSQCLPASSSLLQLQRVDVNTKVPSHGVKMHFQGHKRNSPLFYHYMREKRQHLPHAYMIKNTRSNKFPGHIDIYDKEGNREALEGAVERFKRLDFGAYIRVMIGRSNKKYQKTQAQRLRQEQHVFAYVDFHQKLDRMFTYDLKKKRYFVDDPYEKYNKMSFLKQKYALEKNRILIEEHGNQMYNFDRYRMHMDRIGPMNRTPRGDYMPPMFLETIKDNNGAFLPAGSNVVPELDWVAPHFQRRPIREPDFVVAKKHFHKCQFYLDADMRRARRYEKFNGRLKPWSRIMQKMRY